MDIAIYSKKDKPLYAAHISLIVSGIGEVSPAKAKELDLRINTATGEQQKILIDLGYDIPCEHNPEAK